MPIVELLQLSHALGRPELDAAMLAEGNASCRADEGALWIKASGMNMGSLRSDGLVKVAARPILMAYEGPDLSDAQIENLLRGSAIESERGLKPSVETFMHAYLLSLPGVEYVGHTHPTALLSLLCLEEAGELAKRRLFPDEIVSCGPESAFVPYVDPGLPLARSIRSAVEDYRIRWQEPPKTVWMQNHGLICLGASVKEIESATMMAIKAARVTLSALQTGRPIRWFTEEDILRIHRRPDEHYRQKLLRGAPV